MSQPHRRAEHPSITPFVPPSPKTYQENNHNHPHFPNSAFSGDMAKTYNQRTGGCNIVLANHLISLITPSLPLPATTPTLRILDNACGPMVLTTQCLLNPTLTSYPTIHISAVDISPDFISANRATISSSASAHWNTDGTKVDTALMDGMDLQFPASTFDLSFTSLGIFAFPDPITGARELHRTLKPDGVTAATTWKSVGWLPLLHEVEEMLKPGQPKTRVAFLEPWSVPGKLASTLRDGGFSRVEEREVEGVAWWDGVEETAYWLTATLKLMVGQGWTEGEKEGMEGGFRTVLERGIKEGSGLVMSKGGRVGFRMVAFAGMGWK